MLLIPKGRFFGGTPPRVFLEKRLQAVENKGREREKEGKEIPTGGKVLRRLDLPQRHRDTEVEKLLEERRRVTPPGFCMDVQVKELREKGFVSL
jgi:hypothetical protein